MGRKTYEVSSSFGQSNFFLLDVLRFFIVRDDILYICFFFGV